MTRKKFVEILEGSNAKELERMVMDKFRVFEDDKVDYGNIEYHIGGGTYVAIFEYLHEHRLSDSLAVPGALREGMSLKEVIGETTFDVEKNLIEKSLEQTGGNVTQAAKVLQISHKSMQIKMKELGLNRTDYKE